jgi:putative endopeptidase
LGTHPLGRLYVERYFPLASKDRADAMIAHLMDAYRESIATLDWMGPETRRQALDKLAAIRPMIGYPITWRDYTALVVRRDDLVGNVMRARGFHYNFWLAKLGGGADDAANYGAIGTVIGHEISHAFDDQGSRFDGEGNLRNWWTEEDRSHFDGKTRSLIAQYDAFSPLPGYQVNGALTLGENVADNAGVAVAERAYRLSLGGCAAPVIDGYTGAQRLFISSAQIWRDKTRCAMRRASSGSRWTRTRRASSAPTEARNQGSFDSAFDVKPGDAMYLPPEQRISPWQVDREMVCKEKAR